MANLNKVMLIGRLTRDPEMRTFTSGGKVAHFGFAVNNRKKNPQSGLWEEDPVFLDVEAFNRGDFGKLADTVEQYLRKGKQVYIEGHLKLDQWTQDGQKRSRLKIVADNIQFLDSMGGGPGGGDGPRQMRQEPQYSAPAQEYSSGDEQPAFAEPPAGRSEDIPF